MNIVNDNPTPETDAEAVLMNLDCDDSCATVYIERGECVVYGDFVLGDFARKLERERDDLQKAVNGLCKHLGVSPANTTLLAVEVLKLERERNEAITRRMETIMQCELYEQERDEARERIERQKLEINRLNGATNHAGGTPLKIALRKRDEAREALRAFTHDKTHLCNSHRDMRGICMVCRMEETK